MSQWHCRGDGCHGYNVATHSRRVSTLLPHLSLTGQHDEEGESFVHSNRVWEGELHDAKCMSMRDGKSFYEQRWNRWKKDYVVMLWPVKKDGRWYCRNILFVYICQVVNEVKKSEKISMPTQMIRRFCWFWAAWICSILQILTVLMVLHHLTTTNYLSGWHIYAKCGQLFVKKSSKFRFLTNF